MRLKIPAILLIIISLVLTCASGFSAADTASQQNSESSVQFDEAAANEVKESLAKSMVLVAENETLALYFNEKTTEVAVYDKRAGEAWYSNPVDREQDPIARDVNKDRLSTQIILNYHTSTGQKLIKNNYKDSIKLGQFTTEEIDNGIRINYKIGEVETLYLAPQVVEKQRFEEMILNKVDEKQRTVLGRYYKLRRLEDMTSEAVRKLNLEQFPTLAEFDLYVLTMGLQEFVYKNIDEIIKSTGYTFEDLQADHELHGIPPLEPNLEVFDVSLEYILEGDTLLVRIPSDSIRYEKELYPLYSMHVMPNFGAAGTDQEGYILVPDGSGSLINLNNNKLYVTAFATDVYGSDLALPITERPVPVEQAYMPVYGMKAGDKAFFAIIEDGDASSKIWADVSGRNNSYNTVYPEVILIPMGELNIGNYQGKRSIVMFGERIMKNDIKIRYSFLYGDDANYSGMAAVYRDYLIKKGELKRVEPGEGIPFYLEAIGAIDVIKPILGIPLEVIEPLTTYKEAVDMLQRFIDNDVRNINLKYVGWANGGINHTVPTKFNLINKLGGSKEFKKLQKFIADNDLGFYPETSIIYAYDDARFFDGFRPIAHSSRFITHLVAEVYNYNPATFLEDKSAAGRGGRYIISPRSMPSIVNKMISSLNKMSIPGISLKDAAVDVSSDFRKNRNIPREETADVIENEIKKIKESGISVMVNGGNAYAIPYADHILNLPTDSNKFFITDASIPFYQMVVHGYIEYAGTPINTASNNRYEYLKAVETGSGIYFSLFSRDNSIVKQTKYDYYYSNNIDVWFEDAVALYHKANEALKDVQDKVITDHEILQKNVTKTTFENGKEIIVNYNSHPVTINSVVIDGYDFKVVKEGK